MGKSRAKRVVFEPYPDFRQLVTPTLREMKRDGLIDRKIYAVVPLVVEYS